MNEAMALVKNKKLDVLEVKNKIQLATAAFEKAGNELKEAKKNLFAEKKNIEEKIAFEIKAQIKKEFNYQIPIAEVEKAGISSTGSQIENELEPLAKEFKTYREKNKLWTTYIKEINYQIADEEIGRVRIVDGVVSEPEVFYNKSKY
jgi:type I restriction enzyme M protein